MFEAVNVPTPDLFTCALMNKLLKLNSKFYIPVENYSE